MTGESAVFAIIDFLLLCHFSAMLGLHAAITYTNSRTAVANSLGTIFFLMVGILICAYLIILSDREFGRQLLSFLIFIGAGSVGLFGSLGAKNPSRAIALVSLLTPFWSFYCIISLIERRHDGRVSVQHGRLWLRVAGHARPGRQRFRHRPRQDQRDPGVTAAIDAGRDATLGATTWTSRKWSVPDLRDQCLSASLAVDQAEGQPMRDMLRPILQERSPVRVDRSRFTAPRRPPRRTSTRHWEPPAMSPSPLRLLLVALLFAIPPHTRAADVDLAKELPRIKPLTVAEALRSFQLHAGFRLEAVATEPLVTDPVSACYDADGRLYVVEMRGYPYPENSPTGSVKRLEDIDGDGRFDRATIFVDGLSWPTSVVPYDGGVFIAVAPDIIYAKDTDGDGVADVRKIVFTGFASQNVQGLVNGLLWGPDGWIYGVASSNGGDIKNLSTPDAKPVSVRGRDFRFRPDGSAFEAISGGGQFGHAFDDWGHRFTCTNSNHIRQIVLPSTYLDRNPALAGVPVVADIAKEGPAAPVFRISQAEPWRIVRTRQRAADPEFRRRCRRPNSSPPASSRPPPASRSIEATRSRPPIAATLSSATSAAISSIAKSWTKHGAEFLATRSRCERRVPRLARQLVPTGQFHEYAGRNLADS